MNKFLKTFSLFSISVLVSLFLVELLVKTFFPQQLFILRPDIWKPDSTFGYRHRENTDTEVNMGEGKVRFVTDSNGYRINKQLPPKSNKNDKSILMIGDSFLEGLTVENEYTIPEVVKGYLRNKNILSVEIDNSGVSAWNPNQYYMEAKRALKIKNYDLGVVFLYIGNDLITTAVESYPPKAFYPHRKLKFPRSLWWKEIRESLINPVNDFLRMRSHFYVLFKKTMRGQMRNFGVRPCGFPPIFSKDQTGESRWKVTSSVCAKIQAEFDSYDTPVFFVILPIYYQLHFDIFNKFAKSCNVDLESVSITLPNHLIKTEFAASGLRVADPFEFMKRKTQEGVDMYGSINPHFNRTGNQVLSEYIYPIIASYLTEGQSSLP